MTGAWEDPAVRAAVQQVISEPCMDGPAGCDGPVAYRMPLSGTGQSFPRCQRHWFERLDRQAQIDRRYPDQPNAPADFDPTYAGEVWDDDGW